MPYDKFTDKGEYIDVLNVISQLLYTLNPSHVIIGGDMNVDFSRHTYNTRIFLILLMILIYIHVLIYPVLWLPILILVIVTLLLN